MEIERRSLPRRKRIPFVFQLSDGTPSSCTALDASIRGARFDLSQFEVATTAKHATAQFDRRTPVYVHKFRLADRRDDNFVLAYITRQLAAGEHLDGVRAEYTVMEQIGAGLSAETYRAKVERVRPGVSGPNVDDVVVVKVPTLIFTLSPDERDRFLSDLQILFRKEKRSLERLAGVACVAQFLDHGFYKYPLHSIPADEVVGVESPDAVFMVQEYVEGASLVDDQFTRLNPERFFDVAIKLTRAVRDIHSRMVIHGDLWPENILVRNGAEPVLIDFGQALFRDTIGKIIPMPGQNSDYVAPERRRSVSGDIYSLGGVLHYLATGNPPPRPTNDLEQIKANITANLLAANFTLYRANRGVADVIARCLRYTDRRIANAQVLLDELEIFAGKAGGEPKMFVGAIEKALARIESKGLSLFMSMAARKLRTLDGVLGDMTHRVYELSGGHEEIVAELTQYLSILGKDDEYLTVSFPRFWSDANAGVNGRFLSMTALAAKRGARIRRVFVILDSDKKAADYARILEAQRGVLRELKDDPDAEGSYEVRLSEQSEASVSEMIQEGGHFGLLSRQNEEIAIFPEYRQDGSLLCVRFRAAGDLTAGLRERFEDLWELSSPLSLDEYP
jgi:serine/threonine protein kinase